MAKQKQLIRDRFRNDVFERDNFKCKICGISSIVAHARGQKLDAHHITDRSLMPGGGYVAENGITLCDPTCHMKAEKFHISGGAEWEPDMHPDDLYKLIGSSYAHAVIVSERKLK